MTDHAFTDFDGYLFREGTNCGIYRKLGAHPEGDGTRFAVWAPGAARVSVYVQGHDGVTMEKNSAGIWEGFVPGAGRGSRYHYSVLGADGLTRKKADPCAFYACLRPENDSVVYGLTDYEWHDGGWRPDTGNRAKPMAVYELHPGSWKRRGENGFVNYRALADEISEYVRYMGYTHVELMGISEHPFDGSWGYQVTGFFAPTARYGTPDDFRYFVDTMHRAGIGVILDWVPAHFPRDAFGLERFDGMPLYEPADPLRAEYPEWGTLAFDHGKPEVRSFLLSSAFYWIREFHIDALRVDAVAAMLYVNFSREKYRPNIYGGCENLESIAFLKQLNETVTRDTDACLIAEDSSIMAGMTRKVGDGGIGFAYKWNMGWMNETLRYIERDPVYRKWHHDELTHPFDYAFLESFILVLSHDEVVHLKKSMLGKQPGGLQDRFGGLKALYTLQFTSPGKKLLFMGQDFAEDREWSEDREINWSLTSQTGNRDVMECVRRLLTLYRTYPCLYRDCDGESTFLWVNRHDGDRNILSYIRREANGRGALLVVCNFAPVFYRDYACGVPEAGTCVRVFSTYDALPGEGAEEGQPRLFTEEGECDGFAHKLRYGLRPYEAAVFALPD